MFDWVFVSTQRDLDKNVVSLGNLNKMISHVKGGNFSKELLNRLASITCPTNVPNCCIRVYGASNAPTTRLSCGNQALYASTDAIVSDGFVMIAQDPDIDTTWKTTGCVPGTLKMPALIGATTCTATSNNVCIQSGSPTPIYNLGTGTGTPLDPCTCESTSTPTCGTTTDTCIYCPPANPDCCGTTCTNTKTDNSNCGTCGNICGGGTPNCFNGVCVAQVFNNVLSYTSCSFAGLVSTSTFDFTTANSIVLSKFTNYGYCRTGGNPGGCPFSVSICLGGNTATCVANSLPYTTVVTGTAFNENMCGVTTDFPLSPGTYSMSIYFASNLITAPGATWTFPNAGITIVSSAQGTGDIPSDGYIGFQAAYSSTDVNCWSK